jgi:hypothetical protein
MRENESSSVRVCRLTARACGTVTIVHRGHPAGTRNGSWVRIPLRCRAILDHVDVSRRPGPGRVTARAGAFAFRQRIIAREGAPSCSFIRPNDLRLPAHNTNYVARHFCWGGGSAGGTITSYGRSAYDGSAPHRDCARVRATAQANSSRRNSIRVLPCWRSRETAPEKCGSVGDPVAISRMPGSCDRRRMQLPCHTRTPHLYGGGAFLACCQSFPAEGVVHLVGLVVTVDGVLLDDVAA